LEDVNGLLEFAEARGGKFFCATLLSTLVGVIKDFAGSEGSGRDVGFCAGRNVSDLA
jgi:hypothetical protein